jgi:hypothetical protein
MDRSNHYESAFEAYLRDRRLCYVAVDESRRSLLDDAPVKSLDFIVYGPSDARLLVDVKGRRFPGGKTGQRRVWENWSTADDLAGLARWAERFGAGYEGVLVFAYHVLPGVELPPETPDQWVWHGRRYLFRSVAVADYQRHMRVRSPRWGTVSLPREAFRTLVRPFAEFASFRAPVASTVTG